MRSLIAGRHGISSLPDLSIWYLTKSLPKLLRCADRNSMAFSVESRLPFLDYKLVEYVLGCIDAYKITDQLETKYLLREGMQGVVPKTVLSRTDKIGFAAPDSLWFSGEHSKFIESYILDNAPHFSEIFDITHLKEHLKNKLTKGLESYDNSIWRIFCFINWAKVFNMKLSA